MSKIYLLLLVSLLAISCQAFKHLPSIRKTTKLNMFNPDSVLLLSAKAAEAGDVVYGSVNAPAWALPLGAVIVIASAALPALLSPGEKALEQQRIDEDTKGNKFGNGDAVEKRKKNL